MNGKHLGHPLAQASGRRLVIVFQKAGQPFEPFHTLVGVGHLPCRTHQVDDLRKKIVATKEGGAITGEERLRENLATLYGDVVFYEGRPTQMQMMRTDAIARELADVVRDFDAWLSKELTGLNAALSAKQLSPIKVITRPEWEKE